MKELSIEEYRQRMIQAFHNAGCDELIAVVCLPTEKGFEHLEWLLKTTYKKEPCEDTISKQSAIDALEREKSLVERPITETRWFDFGLEKAQDVLSELPSAQPEIIRCKDCKYWYDICDGRQKHRMCADLFGDWFCADAERRE